MDLIGEGSESSAGDDPAVAVELELAALAIRRGVPRTEEEARREKPQAALSDSASFSLRTTPTKTQSKKTMTATFRFISIRNTTRPIMRLSKPTATSKNK